MKMQVLKFGIVAIAFHCSMLAAVGQIISLGSGWTSAIYQLEPGNGIANNYYSPLGVTSDRSGNLYLSNGQDIVKAIPVANETPFGNQTYTLSSYIWNYEFATIGSVVEQQLAIDSSGNLYFPVFDYYPGGGAPFYGGAIWEYYAPTGSTIGFSSTPPGVSASELSLQALAVDPTTASVYFAYGNAIYYDTSILNRTGPYLVASNLPSNPVSLTFGVNGDLYALFGNGEVLQIANPTGGSPTITSIPINGYASGSSGSIGIDLLNNLYINDPANSQIIQMSAGSFTQQFVATGVSCNNIAATNFNSAIGVLCAVNSNQVPSYGSVIYFFPSSYRPRLPRPGI